MEYKAIDIEQGISGNELQKDKATPKLEQVDFHISRQMRQRKYTGTHTKPKATGWIVKR